MKNDFLEMITHKREGDEFKHRYPPCNILTQVKLEYFVPEPAEAKK